MAALSFDRFAVVGHDRGARVAHRMALDHAERVVRLVLLDVAPTLFVVESTSHASASANYHWYFLTRPLRLARAADRGGARLLPALDSSQLERQRRLLLDKQAVTEYARCFRDPATIHATCEDIRALG